MDERHDVGIEPTKAEAEQLQDALRLVADIMEKCGIANLRHHDERLMRGVELTLFYIKPKKYAS